MISVFSFDYSVEKDRREFSIPEKLRVSGTVKTVPSYSFGNTTFAMKPRGKTNIRELIYVTIDHSENLNLCIGDTITLTGTCYAPDAAMNPGSFDFAEYIKTKGASVVMKSDISAVHSHKNGIFHSVYSFRDRISSKITRYIPGDEGGLANALITGNKEAISDDCNEHYRRSGIYRENVPKRLYQSL